MQWTWGSNVGLAETRLNVLKWPWPVREGMGSRSDPVRDPQSTPNCLWLWGYWRGHECSSGDRPDHAGEGPEALTGAGGTT